MWTTRTAATVSTPPRMQQPPLTHTTAVREGEEWATSTGVVGADMDTIMATVVEDKWGDTTAMGTRGVATEGGTTAGVVIMLLVLQGDTAAAVATMAEDSRAMRLGALQQAG